MGSRPSWPEMKLKRFLLRYDPPGVGLEVEAEDGEKSVQHEDLPPQQAVRSAKDVHAVVERLIEKESALLTRKRHSKALIQLLSRLYNVEVDEEEGEAAAGRGSGDEGGNEGSPTHAGTGINEGTVVVMTNLTGKQQVYNGETGTVTKANPEKQKFEVHVNDETIKVKGEEHLLQVSIKGVLVPEAFVAIRGLRNHIELNGCIAKVAECHEEQQRYEVRATESGQLFRVKKENLVLIEASPAVLAVVNRAKENREPNNATPRKQREGSLPAAVSETQAAGDEHAVLEVGSTVELAGLKTAQAYNGQQAEVLSVDRVRSRYEIRLGDGSVKTIRAENVRLVGGGKSPRSKRPKG